MKKILFIFSGFIITIAPITSIISCSTYQNKLTNIFYTELLEFLNEKTFKSDKELDTEIQNFIFKFAHKYKVEVFTNYPSSQISSKRAIYFNWSLENKFYEINKKNIDIILNETENNFDKLKEVKLNSTVRFNLDSYNMKVFDENSKEIDKIIFEDSNREKILKYNFKDSNMNNKKYIFKSKTESNFEINSRLDMQGEFYFEGKNEEFEFKSYNNGFINVSELLIYENNPNTGFSWKTLKLENNFDTHETVLNIWVDDKSNNIEEITSRKYKINKQGNLYLNFRIKKDDQKLKAIWNDNNTIEPEKNNDFYQIKVSHLEHSDKKWIYLIPDNLSYYAEKIALVFE